MGPPPCERKVAGARKAMKQSSGELGAALRDRANSRAARSPIVEPVPDLTRQKIDPTDVTLLAHMDRLDEPTPAVRGTCQPATRAALFVETAVTSPAVAREHDACHSSPRRPHHRRLPSV